MGKLTDELLGLHKDTIIEGFHGDKKAGETLGYDAEGNAIIQPKTKMAIAKAIKKVEDEAEKFGKANGGEEMQKLFIRLMLTVKDDKTAKKIIKDMVGAQKSSNPPYVKVKSVDFTIPNFKFKGDTLGSEKTAKQAKYGTNPLPMHDRKYRAVHNVLDKVKEIHTSSDLIAHDDYIQKLSKDVKIFIYVVNKGDGSFPSDLRLGMATKKLQDKGFDAKLVGGLSDKDQARVFGKNESLATRVLNRLK